MSGFDTNNMMRTDRDDWRTYTYANEFIKVRLERETE